MPYLDQINNVIINALNNGTYNIQINLSDYSNIPNTTVVITIPVLVQSITFVSDDFKYPYNFSIIAAAGRTANLQINLINVYINSGDNAAIDLSGENTVQTYVNIIQFYNTNTIQSNGNIGILVTNNQSVEIMGANSSSILNVQGGIQSCAIGNSSVFNVGGSIVFSGEGTVNACGGNGAPAGVSSSCQPADGGAGIGFIECTIGNSSITINGNIIVNTCGGNGQECDVSNPNSQAAGNGGPGISLGQSGILIVDTCQSLRTSLVARGGNGGIISDTCCMGAMTDIRRGGRGGSAVAISSGIIKLSGCVILTGGNGTTLALKRNLPVVGGCGGNAVSFTGCYTTTNILILCKEAVLTGGNGGVSGITVDFDCSCNIRIISFNGGKGGSAVSLGKPQSDLWLSTSKLISGCGGQGGSPRAYLESGDLKLNELKIIKGADRPGDGGRNGFAIVGIGAASLRISENTCLKTGRPGSGGIGVNFNGCIVKGKNGLQSKLICVNRKSLPHFGYININGIIKCSLIKCESCMEDLSANDEDKQKTADNIYFYQRFNNNLNIENVNVQKYYNICEPCVLCGNAAMKLSIKTEVKCCKSDI